MSFANPAFLFALSLLAVPVIIHLFNFRKYRRIKFTNVSLLEEVKEKTQSASRLRNLLILLCRLLAVAALVLAFAEPFIGPSGKNIQPAGIVGIYIDNSASMEAEGKDGKLRLTAIERARTIITAFPDNTSFILSTSDQDSRLQRQLTKNEALEETGVVREGYSVRKLGEVLDKQQAIASGKPMMNFMISDFQKSTSGFDNLLSDSSARVSLVPLTPATTNNVSIDSAWFSSPSHLINATEQLSILIRNYGSEDAESITTELQVNGKPAALGNISIPANSSQTLTLNFVNRTAGVANGEIRINDFPISFDNSYFFSYQVNPKLIVFEVNGDNASGAVKNLFSGDEDYDFRSFTDKNIDYNQLKGKGCLVLNGVQSIPSGLRNIVEEKLANGESVAVFPPAAKIDLNSYNTLLAAVGARMLSGQDTTNQKVSRLEERHPFFANLFEKIPQNLDLPSVLDSYKSAPGVSGSQTLMRLQNGNDFLSVTNYKSGALYLATASLNSSSGNFAQHGLFVPVMLRIAETSGYFRQLSYTIGSELPIRLAGMELPRENLLKIQSRDRKTELVPLVRKVNDAVLVYPKGQQVNPGIYEIATREGVSLLSVGFNLSRAESDPAFYTVKELKEISKNSNGRISVLDSSPSKIASAIRENYEGRKLWKVFILLTLVFITAEILLTKWLR
jgi:hypothetical protein